MEVVKQLVEELHQAIDRKEVLEKNIRSLDFCINVMRREIAERLPGVF